MTLTSLVPGAARRDARHLELRAQRWAYPVLIGLLAVSLGVSGAPAPLYGLYVQRWGLSPITTTLVFAAYAVAALGAVLLAGQLSDRFGRKPLLVASLVGMIAGLVVFMTAQDVAALFVARALHGAAVGTAVVAGSAALLDLRPDHGARTGHLSGIMLNVGMATTILGAALLGQFAPDPLVVPYAVVTVVVVVLLLAMLLMTETHTGRGTGSFRVTRPRVPAVIRVDFRFAVLGMMAAWSVLGVYLSLFPAFAEDSTGIHDLVFGGAVVAVMGGAAALSQAVGGRIAARRAAIAGDLGTAVALLLSVLALRSGSASAVVGVGALLGLAFGLAFGGSLRHLGEVVPAAHRGEVMSAFYTLGYTAMALPTILAGWAATTWGIAAVFPWFALLVALACLAAGGIGIAAARQAPAVRADRPRETLELAEAA